MNDFRSSTMKYMGFNDKRNVDLLNEFMDEIANENLDNMAFQREYDDEVESRPSFDQISLRRIQEELSKDLSLLKHFEVLLSDRMTSQSTYISAFSPKIRKPTDIMLLPDASINMTINSMYNYLEQDIFHLKQQQAFYEIRKELRELRHEAKDRLAEYLRDMAYVEKELQAAEKKVHRSREQLELKIQAKLRADAALHADVMGGSVSMPPTPTSSAAPIRQTSRTQSANSVGTRSGRFSSSVLSGPHLVAQSKECDEALLRSEKELKDDIKMLLRATHQYDQVMSASRRAHQRLDADCKKKIVEMVSKFITQERVVEAGRRAALDQLERSLETLSVESDVTAFIKEHSYTDMSESLVLSSQALSILSDAVVRTTLPVSLSSTSLSQEAESRQNSVQGGPVSSSLLEASKNALMDDQESGTPTRASSASGGQESSAVAQHTTTQTTSSESVDSSKPAGIKWDSIMSLQYFAPTFRKQKQQSTLSAANTSLINSSPTRTREISSGHSSSLNTSNTSGGNEPSNAKYTKVSSQSGSLLHSTLLHSTLLPLEESESESSSVQGTEMGPYPIPVPSADTSSVPQSPMKQESPTKRLIQALDDERNALNSRRSLSGDGPTTAALLLGNYNHSPVKSSTEADVVTEKAAVSIALTEEGANLNTIAAAVEAHLSTLFFATNQSAADTETPLSAASSPLKKSTITDDGNLDLDTSTKEDDKQTNEFIESTADNPKDLSVVAKEHSTDIQDAIKGLNELLESSEGRDKFAQGLNQFRSRKVELSAGFEPLGEVLYRALTLCESNHDVHCAKVVMMLSQTFFQDQVLFDSSTRHQFDVGSTPVSPMQVGSQELKLSSSMGSKTYSSSKSSARSLKSPMATLHTSESVLSEPSTARSTFQSRSSRVYLKELLVNHPIWKKKEFWEQILWDCVLDQMERIPYEQPWYELGREGRVNCVRRVHEVVFSQVMAITHSMTEFGCPVPDIREFLYRVCTLHQLSEGHRQQLWAHLKAFEEKQNGGTAQSSPGYEGTMQFY